MIPQLYVPSNTTINVTGSLGSGTLSLSGLTNIALPNALVSTNVYLTNGCSPVYATNDSGNSAGVGFFNTSYGWAGSITNSTLSVTLSGLSSC